MWKNPWRRGGHGASHCVAYGCSHGRGEVRCARLSSRGRSASALAEAVLFELVEAYVLVLDHLLHRVVNIVEFLVEFTVEDLRVEAFHHLAVAPFSCVDAYACGEAHSLSGEADFNLNRPVGGLRRSLSAVENKFYFWCCVHT